MRLIILVVAGMLAANAALVRAQIDADLAPRRAAEEVEARVRSFERMTADVADVDSSPEVSVRCTRVDRLGLPTEKAGIDTRIVWVAEVKDEAGADGAFYVLDDETGEVLAHGVVAGSREDQTGK